MTTLDDLTLEVYLTRAKVTDDPAGDLIADLRRDQLPRILTRRELMDHILLRGGCFEAVQAARPLWKRFRRWQDYTCTHFKSYTSEEAE